MELKDDTIHKHNYVYNIKYIFKWSTIYTVSTEETSCIGSGAGELLISLLVAIVYFALPSSTIQFRIDNGENAVTKERIVVDDWFYKIS